MFNKEDIANIILHVTFMSIFIGTFFFTYGSYIEGKIVENQVKFLIHSNKNIVDVLSSDIKKKIINEINGIKLNFSEEDKKVEEHNKKLKYKAFILFGVCLVVGIIVVLVMSKLYNLPFIHLLKENLIVLFFAGLIYFSYITFFAQNYMSIDPNIIKRKLIETIYKPKIIKQGTNNIVNVIDKISNIPTNIMNNNINDINSEVNNVDYNILN